MAQLGDDALLQASESGDLFGVGEHAAGAGEPDGLVRLIGRLSSLGAEDIDWIERVVIAALSRDEGRPRPGARPDSAPS